MKTITTTIERQWLDKIIDGSKRTEYREIKPYWTKRLEGLVLPFRLRLINGMSKSAPEVTVLINGMDIGPQGADGGDANCLVYRLHIQQVLDFKNINHWKASVFQGSKRLSDDEPWGHVVVPGKLQPLLENGVQATYERGVFGEAPKTTLHPVALFHAGRLWWLHYGYALNTGGFKSRKDAVGWWTRGGR